MEYFAFHYNKFNYPCFSVYICNNRVPSLKSELQWSVRAGKPAFSIRITTG